MAKHSGKSRIPGYIRTVLTDMLILSVCILGAEILMRFVAPQSLHRLLRDVYEITPAGFRYKPGVSTVCNNGHGDHEFSINAWGARDREYGVKQEDEWRILCLGDSFSENQALEVQDIYPKVLEHLLAQTNPTGNYSVINGGMAGWGLWQYHDYLKEMLSRIEPDVVVLAIGGARDVVISDEPPVRKPYTLLAGLPVRAESSVSGRMKWGLWLLNEMAEEYSHAFVAFRRATRTPGIWLGITRVPAFSPLMTDPSYSEQVQAPTTTLLGTIKSLCDDHGVSLAILNVPRLHEVDPRAVWWKIELERPDVSRIDVARPGRLLQTITSSLGIPFHDPSEELAVSPQLAYFPAFGHWNQRGNRIVAEGLLRFLVRVNLINAPDHAAAKISKATTIPPNPSGS